MSDEMEKILDEVFREGEASGETRGKAAGRAEGKVEGKTELAAMMLKEGRYSLEEILKMTGLSAEQVGEATAKYGDK